MERVEVFIDNTNLFRQLGDFNKIDQLWIKSYNPYELAKKLVGPKRNLKQVNFYCTFPPAIKLNDIQRKKKYWQQMNYFESVKKLPCISMYYGRLTGNSDNFMEKDLDTQMAVHISVRAVKNEYDTAIIISNDGDFVSATQEAKSAGKKIELLYFKGKSSMALKSEADISRRARRSYFIPLTISADLENIAA